MSTYEVECPLCESTEYRAHPDGYYECYLCNTSWGSHGASKANAKQSEAAREVAEILRRYTSE
jgi:ribosomal protein L37AE/L43A